MKLGIRFAIVSVVLVVAGLCASAALACEYTPPPCTPGTVESIQFECPVVVVDGGPANTFLCYSRFGASTPGAYLMSEAADLVKSGLTVPFAITPAQATKKGIPTWAWNMVGDYVLACNVDGLTKTGTGINGSSDNVQHSATWKVTLLVYGPAHINHYEIAN